MWLPIESAPRDGRTILVWDPKAAEQAARFPEEPSIVYEPRRIVKWFDTGDDRGFVWCEMGSYKTVEPTLWQPLPVAPSKAILTPNKTRARTKGQ